MSNVPCSVCHSSPACTSCLCAFPPLSLCACCLPKHQSSLLFHSVFPLSAAGTITKDSFDDWQDWLHSLRSAQTAIWENMDIFEFLREKAEKAVREMGKGPIEELKALLEGLCEEVRALIAEAVRETAAVAVKEEPQFKSSLAELIWQAALTGKAANLKLFDPIFEKIHNKCVDFPPIEHFKSFPASYKPTESLQNAENEGKIQEYESEMLNLHLQLRESEASLLSKQGEIEKLNNLLVVKCRKLESYIQKNRSLCTQTKRIKFRFQKLLDKNGLSDHLSAEDILGITEDYRPVDPPPEPNLEHPFPNRDDSPDSPKLPRSNFIYFYRERQPHVKALHPHIASNEVSVIIGEEWKRLSDEQRERYNDLSRKDKERWRGQIRS